jgi:UDP-glucose 4-epimerase
MTRVLSAVDFRARVIHFSMAKVGINGGTGFIGGALIPRLAEAGHELVLIDNRSGPLQIESTKRLAEKADFSSAPGLRLLSECDVIVHLAAVFGIVACAENPSSSSRTNVDGTRRLVELCASHHIPLAFASSFAVVGHPGQQRITETTPPSPTHEYGRQKAEGERIVAGLSETRSAPSAIVRMSNVYGTYRVDGVTADKANVLSMFLRQALAGRLMVNAPGTQRRNFIHIDDVVSHWTAVVDYLAQNPDLKSQTFNVASAESLSILELEGTVARLWREDRPAAPELSIQIVANPRAALEVLDTELNIERQLTDQLLGITCQRSVEETIRSQLGSLF